MLNKGFKMSTAALENGADKNGNRYGGNGFSNSIEPSKVGLEAWKPQKGRNLIDIIPFNATANNPLVIAQKATEGEILYSLDYYTHRDVGPAHSNITCLRQYGKDCPLCRENQRLYNSDKQEDKDIASKIRAKRRVIYVVHDLLRNTYGYWDNSWNTVEKEITKEAAYCIDESTGAKVNVFDWQEGMSIEFQGVEDSWSGHTFIKAERFRFVKREPLTDDVLSHSVDLATTVKMMSEEDMEKLIANRPIESVATPAESEKPVVVETPTFTEMKPAEAPKVEAPKKVLGDKECPFGFVWHDEADKHPECATCPKWEACI